MKIKDFSPSETPLARAKQHGMSALSLSELIAIITKCFDYDTALEILKNHGSVSEIAEASIEELTEVKWMGEAGAASLLAAIEMGRRMQLESIEMGTSIRSPYDLGNYLIPVIGDKEQEHFVVVLLDTRNRVIACETLYIGTVNSSHVRVAEVFRSAIRKNATSIMISHNHPSGDPTPSPEDVEVTRQIKQAGDLLGIDLTDHLVIGNGRFVSLRERGLGFS